MNVPQLKTNVSNKHGAKRTSDPLNKQSDHVTNSSEPRSFSSSSIMNSIVAGNVAGICGTVVGHPLDSIKVLMQTNTPTSVTSSATTTNGPSQTLSTTASTTAASVSNPSTGKSISRAAASTSTTTATAAANTQANNMSTLTASVARPPAQRSIRSLYAGISGPLVTIGLTQAINFSIFDTCRRVMHERDHPGAPKDDYLYRDSLTNVAISAGVAGTAISIFTSPLQVIKTKQQVMVWSFRRAIEDGLRSAGLRSFYVGFGPHLFCDGLGRSVYFTTYEVLKRCILEQKRASLIAGDSGELDAQISIPERMICAAIGGMACWTFIFPMDVLRCRLYAQAVSSTSQAKQSTLQLIKSMYKESGNSLSPFFRGFSVTVARAGPVAAAVLPVYDLTLECLVKGA